MTGSDRAAVTRIRSLLFVPASDRRKLQKALGVTADALIIDLEDAVAPDVLPSARENVVTAVASAGSPPVFVRVNHPLSGLAECDLEAAVRPGLFGIVVPKVEDAADIREVEAMISALEDERGMEPGAVVVLPLVESGLGVRACFEIATSSERVVGMAFSSGEEGDFMADIDAVWTPDGAAMAYARGRVVSETRAAGLDWPVDGVFMNFQDPDALAIESRLARTMGFQAKMAVHPGQLEIINAAFTPSAEEVDTCRRMLAAYDRAVAEGIGAVQFDGRMLDKANIARARKVIARAAR